MVTSRSVTAPAPRAGLRRLIVGLRRPPAATDPVETRVARRILARVSRPNGAREMLVEAAVRVAVAGAPPLVSGLVGPRQVSVTPQELRVRGAVQMAPPLARPVRAALVQMVLARGRPVRLVAARMGRVGPPPGRTGLDLGLPAKAALGPVLRGLQGRGLAGRGLAGRGLAGRGVRVRGLMRLVQGARAMAVPVLGRLGQGDSVQPVPVWVEPARVEGQDPNVRGGKAGRRTRGLSHRAGRRRVGARPRTGRTEAREVVHRAATVLAQAVRLVAPDRSRIAEVHALRPALAPSGCSPRSVSVPSAPSAPRSRPFLTR